MKKLIAVLLCLLMLCPCALAENAALDIPSWAESEALIAEKGWTGAFHELPELGIRLWLPDTYMYNDLMLSMVQFLAENVWKEGDKTATGNNFTAVQQDRSILMVIEFLTEGNDLSGVAPGIESGKAVSVNGLPCVAWQDQKPGDPTFGADPSGSLSLCVQTGDNRFLLISSNFPNRADGVNHAVSLCILSSVQPLE